MQLKVRILNNGSITLTVEADIALGRVVQNWVKITQG